MAKKIMITQDDYFPAHSNIFDVLCLPNKSPTKKAERKQLKTRAEFLLIEANFDRNIDLDEIKTNWAAELSGGQKKKIKLISAILQKPDLLLLDEVFVGLDAKSVKNIQKMLNRELPNTTIISVDHHPDQSKDFYTSHYEIKNSKICHRVGTNIHNKEKALDNESAFHNKKYQNLIQRTAPSSNKNYATKA